MTAQQKIEKLTHSWYGYAVCATLFSIVQLRTAGIVGFAIGLTFWAALNAVLLVISLALIALFSRKLLAKSSATRSFLIGVSALFGFLGALSVLNTGTLFLRFWSVGLVFQGIVSVVHVWMNVRSFGVLMSPKVRAYFAS